jgi:hypothetical protein
MRIEDFVAKAAIGDFDSTLDSSGVPAKPLIVVDSESFEHLDSAAWPSAATLLRRSTAIVVVIATASNVPERVERAADLVLAGPEVATKTGIVVTDPLDAAERLSDRISKSARASIALVWLLRLSEGLSVYDAIVAESATYSSLQAGPDFLSWLKARPGRRDSGQAERVRLRREDNVLYVTLSRRDRRNAVDAAMRDSLREALQVAIVDTSLRVVIDADGPSFSSGGDLDEFGTASDPATSHLLRVSTSVGWLIHQLRGRTTVRLHGDCIGAGIELPAFAGTVIASPETRVSLPEIGMGLIPGAGGTVSLPRRIGRGRTAWLALSGETIDAATALQWNLVDAVE